MTFLSESQLSRVEDHYIDRLGVFLGAKVKDTIAIVILWIVHWSNLFSAQKLSRPIMRTLRLHFFFVSEAQTLNPQRTGGGRNPPPRHFLLYLSHLLFFNAETQCLFLFKPCTQFWMILNKIGPMVMAQRCVKAYRVQRKTDQKLIFNGNHTQIVFFFFFFFFFFRIHFHFVLSDLFGLFGVRTCVSKRWHTSLQSFVDLCIYLFISNFISFYFLENTDWWLDFWRYY